MALKITGEQRNAQGKCYMTPCGKKAVVEVTYYGKKVMVCKGHIYVNDN